MERQTPEKRGVGRERVHAVSVLPFVSARVQTALSPKAAPEMQ
jgi:hypothetical protein